MQAELCRLLRLNMIRLLLSTAGLMTLAALGWRTVTHLEVCIDNIKTLGVFRQLDSDVSTANKNGLQGLPLLLNIQPRVEHDIHCAQLLLPVGHNFQELGVALKQHIMIQ